MHSKFRLATSMCVLALAGVLVVTIGSDTGTPVDIGTALQTHEGSRSAASRAEQVRYDDIELELHAAYLVVDGVLDAPAPAPAEHEDLWAQVVRVLPESAHHEIRQLNVVTDGPNGTLAMVHRSGVAADHWILSIDIAEPSDVLAATLVHEYAHMLSMRRADLTTGVGSCDGAQLAIGCARHGSALADWSDAFWGDLAEPAAARRDRFVSEYAATAVHEDLAESFLAYVTGEIVRSSPEIAAKLAFFDGRSEFATAAATLRGNLSPS